VKDPATIAADVLKRVRVNKYMAHTPHPRQAAFLLLPNQEALFGGAARGGKTDCLLMAALQYVDVPGYSAVIFRRTYPQLMAAGGVIPRSKEWLGGTDATFNEGQKLWTFPSGAELRFAHCQHLKDVEAHERGPEYQFIGWDELTTFQKAMYERINGSRLSRPSSGPLSRVPLRVRGGTNPGGEGHEWVKRHFLTEGAKHGRVFLRSLLRDNPSVDARAYLASLEMLDPVSQARMRDGDWDVVPGGDFFRQEWFEVLAAAPAVEQRVRFWDCAASTNQDNARTAGVLMGRTAKGQFPILDVDAFWLGPTERDQRIVAQAHIDGREVPIRIEHEPGGGGVHQAQDQVRMLAGFDVEVVRPLGSKPERASPLARQVKAGNVPLVSSGDWVGAFLAEVCAFPNIRLKDQVDAASGAFLHLTQFGPITATSSARPAQAASDGEAPEAETGRAAPRLTWAGASDPRRGRLFR
jgi:predicted phage terminase large subunit-like protein